MRCDFCDGACADADLSALLDERLIWLWERVAIAAERRADARLTDGTLSVRAPVDAEQRASAVGLLGGRPLGAGSARRVDLSDLTTRLRVRGSDLTPGAVAAHALKRRLAARAEAREARAAREEHWSAIVAELHAEIPLLRDRSDPSLVWSSLRRAGWAARLEKLENPDLLLRRMGRVVASLPPPRDRADRRGIANDVAGDPHALDEGSPLGGIVLALLVAAGVVPRGHRPRHAWDNVGVDCDDLTGGLIAIGIHPLGWRVPTASAVTLPPRELMRCTWPTAPNDRSWVFVTENPSVVAAAADLVDREGLSVRLLCTSGTPSDREIAAIERMARVGWRIAVRADFDHAGLAHVGALLSGVPDAVPWRMGSADYVMSGPIADDDGVGMSEMASLPQTPWDPELRDVVAETACATYEEALMSQLLADLRTGQPPNG